MPDNDAESYALAHFGIKGMRWGVRNERTAADVQGDLDKLEKSRSSITRKLVPATSVLGGAGARAGTAKRVLNLKAVKNPDGSIRLIPTDKTPTITDANRKQFDKKIDRQTYLKYAATGAIVTASLLGTAYLGHTKLSDPSFQKLVVKGSLALAGAQILQTTSVTAGVHRNVVDRQLTEQKKALKKELKGLSTN